MNEEIKLIADQIKKKIGGIKPEIALILGSGLGGLADMIENPVVIPYSEIEGLPRSTVSGHAGRMVIGKLGGKDVLCLQGRVHLYEGHAPSKIALLVRTLKEVGAKTLFLTNAAGSLRKDLPPGSLMLISDHINYAGLNPLIGPNDENIGPRFPDMSQAYSPELRAKVIEAAEKEGVSLKEGIYIMTSGPNFETPAEINMFARLGADAVGMSTVPETLVGVHCGMKVVGVSVITNYGAGMTAGALTHGETIEQADKAAKKLERVIARFIAEK